MSGWVWERVSSSTAELSASEDLTVEGCVEGQDPAERPRTHGRLERAYQGAGHCAEAIVVLGQVTGNLIATEKVDIKESGSVEGDIVAPRVAIADGSHFRGSIDMQKKDQPTTADQTIGGFETESKTGKPDTQKPEPSSLASSGVRLASEPGAAAYKSLGGRRRRFTRARFSRASCHCCSRGRPPRWWIWVPSPARTSRSSANGSAARSTSRTCAPTSITIIKQDKFDQLPKFLSGRLSMADARVSTRC